MKEFVGKVGNDKLFLVAPLMACSEFDLDVVNDIFKDFLQLKELSFIRFFAHLCSGIIFTETEGKDEEILFNRNEKLIKYLSQSISFSLFHLLNKTTPYLGTLIKACHIMNLIKFKPSNRQRILLEIYLDEPEDSLNLLFDILLKISRTDSLKKTIESYK